MKLSPEQEKARVSLSCLHTRVTTQHTLYRTGFRGSLGSRCPYGCAMRCPVLSARVAVQSAAARAKEEERCERAIGS
eukprot:1657623-Rhodomonas_salina.4